MPYKNIVWIKLEKRLLNDYRFYTLSEQAQLTYIKLLLLAAETQNKLPKNPTVLRSCIRSTATDSELESQILEIKKNFPKFKETSQNYYFYEWSSRHNFVSPKELPRNSLGTPGEHIEKRREDKIKEDDISDTQTEPFSFPVYLEKVLKDSRRPVHIIGLYWKFKNLVKPTLEATQAQFRRELKAAKNLVGYTDDQIIQTMEYLDSDPNRNYVWTLETILKRVDNVINNRS
jgi:hypothetical protein